MVGAIAHDLRTPLTRLAFRLDDLPPPLGEKVSADIHEMKSMISVALDFIRDHISNDKHERSDFRQQTSSMQESFKQLTHPLEINYEDPVAPAKTMRVDLRGTAHRSDFHRVPAHGLRFP
jgi:two-component system OmpR family sensor kinase